MHVACSVCTVVRSSQLNIQILYTAGTGVCVLEMRVMCYVSTAKCSVLLVGCDLPRSGVSGGCCESECAVLRYSWF